MWKKYDWKINATRKKRSKQSCNFFEDLIFKYSRHSKSIQLFFTQQ